MNNKIDISKLQYWKERKYYYCTIPRNDLATEQGFYWKEYGLIGKGETREEALQDWVSWVRISDLVADIY